MRRLVRALIIGSIVVAIVRLAMLRRATAGAPEERGAPLRPLRSFVTRRFDPFVLRLGMSGGPHSPWALVEHVGRKTGHVYRTPVVPLPMDGGYEIPLAFGADVDWLRNVVAAGRARLQVHETIIEVDRPEIVEGADARSLAPPIRRFAARRGYRYLRLHTVASMPGTFSHLEGHAVPPSAGEPIAIPAEEPIGVRVEPAIEPEPRTQPRPSGEPEPVDAASA